MANIDEYNCNKVTEYFDIINLLKDNWDKEHPFPEYPYAIYRGQSNRWPLIPSVFRTYGKRQKYEYSEFKIFNAYNRYISSLEGHDKAQNNLEIIMNMQHYNMPTRLLDWTENSLTALYFAIIDSDINDTPIVWVLHSGKLNSLTTKDRNAPFISSSPHSRNRADLIGFIENETIEESFFEKYKEYKNYRDYLEKPICYTPKITNRRMAAQQSVFTINGTSKKPIENYFDANDGLCCIKIQNNCIDKMKKELFNIGIRSRNILPDIEGLSIELKQEMYRLYKR